MRCWSKKNTRGDSSHCNRRLVVGKTSKYWFSCVKKITVGTDVVQKNFKVRYTQRYQVTDKYWAVNRSRLW